MEITSYEVACKYLKRDPKQLPNVSKLPKKDQLRILAREKMEIVIEAINKKFNNGKRWIADYFNDDQIKWYIWWRWEKESKKSGFRFEVTHYGLMFTTTAVGPRFSFVSEAAARYFASNHKFIELYNQAVKQ